MNATSHLVTRTLFRVYRPVALWFISAIVVGVAVADAVITRFVDPGFSTWLLVAGSAAKYWLLVVGILLVTMHLRQYVTNGVTRRDFLRGAGVFSVILAVFFALWVPVGHGVESTLLGLDGTLAAGYPPFSLSVAVREFGHALPGTLAYLVSGIAISAGFYRYRPWRGLLLLLPGALPLVVTEALLGIDQERDLSTRFVPYLVALAASLLVIALAVALYHVALRDVAIRRTG